MVKTVSAAVAVVIAGQRVQCRKCIPNLHKAWSSADLDHEFIRFPSQHLGLIITQSTQSNSAVKIRSCNTCFIPGLRIVAEYLCGRDHIKTITINNREKTINFNCVKVI